MYNIMWSPMSIHVHLHVRVQVPCLEVPLYIMHMTLYGACLIHVNTLVLVALHVHVCTLTLCYVSSLIFYSVASSLMFM